MHRSHPERIHPRGADATAAIKAIAEAYKGESVAEVRAAIVVNLNRLDLEPSEYLPTIAQRIVDGHRGEDIFDY